MRTANSIAALAESIGHDRIRLDPDLIVGYSRDSADLTDSELPFAVVSPRSVGEVQETLRWATVHRVPVIPRGNGTGLSGGACGLSGSIVVSTERLTEVRVLSADDRLAIVEPGVDNAALNRAAGTHGLMFAPDPSSWETCTVGGNVATNAGGLRCVRYGTTRANVLGLEVVLADGRLLRTGGRTLKRSSGYDLTQLFIGSEGTLGVVTAVTTKLVPLPERQVTCMATFGRARDAAAAASAIARALRPTLVELMDRGAVSAVNDFRSAGFDSSVDAVLLVQVDAFGSSQDVEAIVAKHAVRDVVASDDAAVADDLLAIRRAAYPAAQSLGTTLIEDVCVPISRLADLIESIADIGSSTGTQILTVAHAGDGNAHPILVLDADPAMRAHGLEAADAIFRRALDLGGTVSGEHGIGRLKRGWLEHELSVEALDVHRALKSALDPNWLLNPGAIFESA